MLSLTGRRTAPYSSIFTGTVSDLNWINFFSHYAE
jgi:hypothetical protein